MGESPILSAKVGGSLELYRFMLDMPEVSLADGDRRHALIANLDMRCSASFRGHADSKNRRSPFER